VNIIEAIDDRHLFGSLFKKPETWAAWRVFLRALFNLPITDGEDLDLLRQCTGLDEPPAQTIRECAAICGRRSGKSFMSAIIAVFLACFKDWQPYLSPGERGMIFIIAVDRSQAQVIKNYVSGILNGSKILRGMIDLERQEQIDLKNRVSIAIKTCNYRSLRGFTVLCAILEETAFWRSEESANPDIEVLNAIRPALATVQGLLIAISTPYTRAGILFDMFKRHYGQAGASSFVWKAPSLTMNPTLSQEIINSALEDDPEAAKAEWEAEWRTDVSAFIPQELIEAAVIPGRWQLPKADGFSYHAFTDPSGGSVDSFSLAIAHHEKTSDRVVLDLLEERRPPFSPQAVVDEFAKILQSYGVHSVRGDRYAGEWVRECFQKANIGYEHSGKNKSEIYLEFLPLMSRRGVELLDNKRLVSQIRGLERRTRSGGADLVDHYKGGHDDLINSVAGVVWMARARTGPRIYRLKPLGEEVGERMTSSHDFFRGFR
jgi:hypothetical protein